ncbi:MAG: beta-galactosidase, partial [Armatimonadetes bacterium]|nr:beta-galactosidase [Anaerolineae bacterium]
MRSRQPFLLLCALIALCGSLTAALATAAQRDFELRGYSDPTQTTELPFRVPRLGVNAELMQYLPDELPTHFAQMQAAQIHWVRQFARWDNIEPVRGRYDWASWDAVIAAADAQPELALVVVLVNTPAWARQDTLLTATAPPTDLQSFAAFTAAFAARYGQTVDYYQIWDEPNLSLGWGGLSPRPVEYLALLQAAYTSIHRADSSATVIAAALAPTAQIGDQTINDWHYLRDLYALGAADFMDAVAAKPYGFDTAPDDRTVDPAVLNFSRLIGLREVMTAAGDGKSAVWAANWGWNSLPVGWTGAPSIWGQVDSATRTAYTLAALDRAEREWAWLGGMILYHWQPDAPLNDPVWGFALLNPENTPTPLYGALVSRARDDTAASNGMYLAANPYARYSGVWTFSALGADIGWLQDSQFTFAFTGRDIALLLREDDYVGYLYPVIDGQATLVNALPSDAAGNPYVILTSDT